MGLQKIGGWLLAAAILFGARAANAQDVDPFYLKTLKDGESLILAQKYLEAVQSLEIAAFGLHARPDLVVKAQAYLALGYSRLNEKARFEAALKAVLALTKNKGLREIDLAAALRPEIDKLIDVFIRESAIEQDPNRSEAYLALADVHIRYGDPRSARNAVSRLLQRNPSEARAFLALGKILFLEKEAKEAEKTIGRFLARAREIGAEERLVREAKACLILCADLRGDSQKTADLVKQAPELLRENGLEGVSFGPKAEERLRAILAAVSKK